MRQLYKYTIVNSLIFILFSLLFNFNLKAQTLTVAGATSNLTINMAEGAADQALLGFSITPTANVNLGTIKIVTPLNLNENFIAASYEMGTCPTSTYNINDFTVVPSNAVNVTANPVVCTMNMPLVSGVTYYFFFRADVRTTFNTGYPITRDFSILQSDVSTFISTAAANITTNAYTSVINTATPNNLAPAGIAYQWTSIPSASPTSNTSRIARTWLNDRDTTLTITGSQRDNNDANATAPNNWQAFGIIWATAQASVSSVKFFNGEINGGLNDDGYFDSAPSIQYATNAAGNDWAAATGTWLTTTPVYPVSSNTASYKTYLIVGSPLTNVTGIRIIGRTRASETCCSWRVHAREIEVSNRRIYYFKPVESDLTVFANWGVNPTNGTGTQPTQFTGNDLFILTSSETLSGNIASSGSTVFQVGNGGSGVTLDMGTNTISNAVFNIPLASSGSNTIKLAAANLPILGNLSTGVYGNTLEFNGTIQNVPVLRYNYLKINNYGTKSLAGSTTVSQNLTILGGVTALPNSLFIGNYTLTLNGTFTGSAANSLSLNGASNLNIGGTGTLGTLYFDQTTPGKSFGTSNTDFVPLSIGSTNRLNNFTINRTSIGTVTLGNELQITNLLTPTAGTLTTGGNLVMLNTDATTSSILALNSASDISGNVNVQSFFKGGTVAANRGFRMIASPTANTGTFFAQLRERFIITCDPATGSGCDFRPLRSPNAQTLTNYNEPGLTAGAASFNPINHASLMEIGRGYYFFFRGNRSNLNATTPGKINEPFSLPEDWTATYIGAINKGDIIVPVTKTTSTANTSMDGLNLIGNPYPAVLNFTSFQSDAINSGIIDDFLMIMKRDRTGFITYSGGVLTAGTISAVQSAGGTTASYPFIQPGQGFFVRKKDPVGTANVTFKENHKAAAADSQKALRTLEAKQKSLVTNDIDINAIIKKNLVYPAVRQLIRFNIKSDENQDDAVVVLEDGNSANYGGNDAPYMANNNIYTYSLTADSIPSSINFMPTITDVKEIKLFVESTTSNPNLKLNFTDLTGAGKNEVWLKDNFMQTNTLITASNNSYNFGIDKNIKSTSGKDRFSLFFVPKIVYEINLNNFTATANNLGIQLNWETKTETNSSKFELERSADGVTFETIQSQATKAVGGNSRQTLTYSFLDKTAQIGTVYYRLKMVVKDKTSTNSDVKNVEFNFSDKNTLIVFPSLVKDELNVTWKAKNKENLSLAIYDVNGKMVLKFNNIKGQSFTGNMAILNAGTYILKLKGQITNSQIAVSKFVKN